MSKKRTSKAKEDAKLVQQMNTSTTHVDEDPAQKKHLRIKTFTYKNDAQATFGAMIDSKDITVCGGCAGTGKSFVSIYKALELMKRFPDKYEQIVITKPNVESGPSLGFLKGTLEDKMAEYIYSMKYIFNILLDSAKTTRMFTSEQIRVMPMGFVRGVTLSNCVFILDEAQNTTPTEMKSILSRIGPDCKMIINGDENQVDTKLVREKTGLHAAMTKLRDIPQIGIFEFSNTDIVRHPLISIILDRMEGK